MKKLISLWALTVILSSCWTEAINSSNNSPAWIESAENRNQEIISLQPEYKAELYWKVKSIEWNMFTISEIDTSKDPTIWMEQTEKKAYMQGLSEADRMALKEMILSSVLWDVKVMIPVWIPMIKKELQWEEKTDVEATLDDLKNWDVISIWYNKEVTDRKIAQYVKRSIRR